MVRVSFSKMQGAGNDFVVVDAREQLPFDTQTTVPKLCDRRFGVGADGVIALEHGSKAPFRMRYWNADGSAAVCGNGARCISRFIADHNLLPEGEASFELETDEGVLAVSLLEATNAIRISMGKPRFAAAAIPTTGTGEHQQETLELTGGETLVFSAASMGNPHCITYVDSVASAAVERIGPAVEHHPLFPERTNVEFVERISGSEVQVRVWERGVGETLACGTGACALVAAGVRDGLLERRVVVHMPGGDLTVEWDEHTGCMYLEGPAVTVFTGTLDLND